MKKVDLHVTKMHCASCSALIDRALTKTKGVQDANVNFSTAKATVVFNEKHVG